VLYAHRRRDGAKTLPGRGSQHPRASIFGHLHVSNRRTCTRTSGKDMDHISKRRFFGDSQPCQYHR